jgi:hypothetical protein
MSNITLNRLVLRTRKHQRQYPWQTAFMEGDSTDDEDEDDYPEKTVHVLESTYPEKKRPLSSMGFMKPDPVLSAQHPAMLKAPSGPPIVILPGWRLSRSTDSSSPHSTHGYGWFDDGARLKNAS